MATLKGETALTLDAADMQAILTEELCRYNAFGQLTVTEISQNERGDFDLVLSPKPQEEE